MSFLPLLASLNYANTDRRRPCLSHPFTDRPLILVLCILLVV